MTVVINLIGGSGLGKSTTAALIFGEMKLQGLHCELVREYVKEWAWAGRKIEAGDQKIIFENQYARENLYYNKLDYIVTDSPLLLGPMYEKFYTGEDPTAELVFDGMKSAEKEGVTYVNFFLKRNKAFDPRGRYETEEQAKEVDAFMEKYLTEKSIPFHTINTNDKERVTEIINKVLKKDANTSVS
jgi:adenylate kinase family enzyme